MKNHNNSFELICVPMCVSMKAPAPDIVQIDSTEKSLRDEVESQLRDVGGITSATMSTFIFDADAIIGLEKGEAEQLAHEVASGNAGPITTKCSTKLKGTKSGEWRRVMLLAAYRPVVDTVAEVRMASADDVRREMLQLACCMVSEHEEILFEDCVDCEVVTPGLYTLARGMEALRDKHDYLKMKKVLMQMNLDVWPATFYYCDSPDLKAKGSRILVESGRESVLINMAARSNEELLKALEDAADELNIRAQAFVPSSCADFKARTAGLGMVWSQQ